MIADTNLASEGVNLLRQADKSLCARREDATTIQGWTKSTLGHLSALLPLWSRAGDAILKDYCRWAFKPRPPTNSLLAFTDCVLDFAGDGIVQVSKATVHDCYSLNPAHLIYKPRTPSSTGSGSSTRPPWQGTWMGWNWRLPSSPWPRGVYGCRTTKLYTSVMVETVKAPDRN